MLIKPDLKDEEIIACLREAYGLTVEKIAFLPLGADFNTVVYRVTTSSQVDYFLKLRRGEFIDASVSAPKYLADLGIKQVISPLATKTGQLWTSLASFKAILYPYVEGQLGFLCSPDYHPRALHEHQIEIPNILKCETCGNNMQLISVVEDFFLIEATMTALGLDPKPPNVKSAVSRTLFYEDFSN